MFSKYLLTKFLHLYELYAEPNVNILIKLSSDSLSIKWATGDQPKQPHGSMQEELGHLEQSKRASPGEVVGPGEWTGLRETEGRSQAFKIEMVGCSMACRKP